MADIPSAEEIRAIVAEAVAPLREEIARLVAQQSPEGMSVAEAAKRMGVSERTIKRGVKDESIPSTKVRGRRVILLADILPSNDKVVQLAQKLRRR